MYVNKKGSIFDAVTLCILKLFFLIAFRFEELKLSLHMMQIRESLSLTPPVNQLRNIGSVGQLM